MKARWSEMAILVEGSGSAAEGAASYLGLDDGRSDTSAGQITTHQQGSDRQLAGIASLGPATKIPLCTYAERTAVDSELARTTDRCA